MAREVLNEDTNEMETMYTQAELDAMNDTQKADYEAKLAEKDEHVKNKLEEFKQGKTASQLKEEEREAELNKIRTDAEEAKNMAIDEKNRRINTVQDFAIAQYVGDNKELADKIKEFLPMVNMETKDDADILKKVGLAATMAGLAGNGAQSFQPQYMGGMAPRTNSQETVSDADHATFLAATGYVAPTNNQ